MKLSIRNRIIIEAIFFVILFFVSSYIPVLNFWEGILFSFIPFCFLYAHAIINRFFIFPFLFPKKRFLVYLMLTVLSMIFFMLILNDVQNALYKEVCMVMNEKYTEGTYFDTFSALMLSLFVMSSIEFFFSYLKMSAEKTENERLTHELESNNLKAQLNPHFLFNSLNNAYGLCLSNSEKAADYILNLSQLMRYQIESVKKETVSLKEDVSFIENYLAVERIRLGERCDIDLESSVLNRQDDFTIAPLILFTFIENAIKHSTNGIGKSWVKISLKKESKQLIFNCSNSKHLKKSQIESTFTGLKNVQQRLKRYDPKHSLKIEDEELIYSVFLTIQLH